MTEEIKKQWTDELITKQYSPLIKEIVNSPWPNEQKTREEAVAIIRGLLEASDELPW